MRMRFAGDAMVASTEAKQPRTKYEIWGVRNESVTHAAVEVAT